MSGARRNASRMAGTVFIIYGAVSGGLTPLVEVRARESTGTAMQTASYLMQARNRMLRALGRNYECGWRPLERAATLGAPLVFHTRRRHGYRNDPLGAARPYVAPRLRSRQPDLDVGVRHQRRARAALAHDVGPQPRPTRH